MHMLARNFAIQLKETMKLSIDSEYETPLNYNKVFFCLTDDGQYVSVEEYITGHSPSTYTISLIEFVTIYKANCSYIYATGKETG